MKTNRVPGKNKTHRVRLYALSTCVWCKRTKQLLKESNIEFEYVDIDLCNPKDQDEIKKDILSHGGSIGFPTLIIDDNKVITGFREEEIRKELGI